MDGSASETSYGLVNLRYNSTTKRLTCGFPSGWSMTIGVGAKMLAVATNRPESARDKTWGLLGTYNDQQNDDLQLLDQTGIPSNASLQQIHNDFGQKCKLCELRMTDLRVNYEHIYVICNTFTLCGHVC